MWVLLAVVAAIVALAAWPHPREHAGWARRRDLRPLRVRDPTPGRLTIGRVGSRLLAAERRASLVVLGPSQSGKTTGLAIPAILEWEGPVVATSVKADLVQDTIAARRERGPVWVFDPTGSTGLQATGWSPLDGCGTWAGARQTASWLCRAAQTGGLHEEEFWSAAAAKLLGPYLLAAAASRREMQDVLRWLDVQEEAEVADILDNGGHEDALRAATASWQRDDRTRSSVFTTAEIALEAYADPTYAARPPEIDPERLVRDKSSRTLYICAPGHEQERMQPLFATLLSSVIRSAVDEVGRRHRALDPPLLVVLDEAANIAPLRDLDQLASTAAGLGIQLVTVWQDLAQIRARYGEKASTVVNNHRAKIVLSGISDPATLEYASRLIGDTDIHERSVTTGKGGRSTTRSLRERRLAPGASLRRIRPGQGILVYGHLPPIRMSLRSRPASRS